MMSGLLEREFDLEQFSMSLTESERKFNICVAVINGAIVKPTALNCIIPIESEEVTKEDIDLSDSLVLHASPIIVNIYQTAMPTNRCPLP